MGVLMATRTEIDAAFAAGYSADDEYEFSDEPDTSEVSEVSEGGSDIAPVVPAAVTLETPVAAASEVPAVVTPETPAVVTPEVNIDPVVDEWAGVPDAIKAKFEQMSVDLDSAVNIAKSASGRANKLQSLYQKQEYENRNVVKPTSEQIKDAMTNKESREALRNDGLPEVASAFDAMDISVSTSVGDTLDKFKNELLVSTRQFQEDFEMKRILDKSHPEWEYTVQNETFKNWAYENGPNINERLQYETLLSNASSLQNSVPGEANAIFAQADNYYNNLLSTYPEWANDKGSLYGDPSANAAITLLDKYSKFNNTNTDVTTSITEQPNVIANAAQAKNQQILADNVAPTNGAGPAAVPDMSQDVDEAFKTGFYGHRSQR